ncbi:unnamed protein product [Adineta ricciae]|nr:unnamed protein product [Adineta ricciae]
MISSDINTYQTQETDDNTYVASNFISSAPANRITTHAESIVFQALPAPLAAPVGWRSQIIHSNSPVFTDEERRLLESKTTYSSNYSEYNTNAGVFNASAVNRFSAGYTGNSDEYTSTSLSKNRATGGHVTFANNESVAENALALTDRSVENNALVTTNRYHDNQTVLTERQQHDIIQRVEHQQPPPLIVRKSLPNNTVTYRQNVSVRYLQPPTPPPPGPLIIREVQPPPPPPQSPIKIQQRAPPLPTPPPLVLRERPPPPPETQAPKVVEKLLPPLPGGPRPVIVERYGACPPKPQDVIIERWLPYKQTGERRVVVERAPPPCVSEREPNLLILHDGPRACIRKEYINQGVVRADPDCYIRQYGGELNRWESNSQHAHLVSEASRAVPPPFGTFTDRYHEHCPGRYERARTPCIESSTWERVRAPTSIPRCSSYSYVPSCCEPTVNYCKEVVSDCDYSYRQCYDDCYRCEDRCVDRCADRCVTTTDIIPSWNRYCRSSSYDCVPSWNRYCRSSSYDCLPSCYSINPSCSSKTIRVCSDDEFRRVLCDLTNGHVSSGLRSLC